MIDTRLKVFRSVATLLSFTKAANELFISQPAISKHIQELEKEYGVQLFDRIGNRIQLTRAGQLMLDHACKIIDAYQNLDFDMKKLTEKSGGELRIGASTTISQYVLPELIAEFRKLYPDIRITLLSGNSHEIEDALAAGRIDLGMVEGIKRQPTFKYTPFMKDELVAFVHCSNPLAQQDEISLNLLRQTPIVLRELGSGTLDVIQKALQENGIALSDLNIEMNLGTTEGIKHFVEHSLSMGIISIRAIYRSIYEQVFKVLEPNSRSTIGVCLRRSREISSCWARGLEQCTNATSSSFMKGVYLKVGCRLMPSTIPRSILPAASASSIS
jgi:DNA-binding transcriptional LysR family regulator